jgi:putative peptidoglycan lipid II flippase
LKLFRSGIIVAFFTLISRIFGLIRELFIASLFGSTSLADSVNVAFKLPNLFRRIFGEGALSTVFIPIFNEKIEQSNAAVRKFTGEIFTLLLLATILLVLLMIALMEPLMYVIAPGFHHIPEKFNLTILLCRITIPYLVFISVTALFGGILNSVGKFAAFAFVPVLLNIVVIIGTLFMQQQIQPSIAISISVVLAGVLQVMFMYYCLKRANLLFPLLFNYEDKAVKKFLINMGPATISSGVQQLNLFISQSIASFIPGAVSILSYADRIYQFPLSIIGVTFGTILLPELSKIYKTNDMELAFKIQNKAIKGSILLSLPAMIGIIILSHPIIHIIYERGAFTAEDTTKTATAISAFALGLPAFVLAKILTPIFYANHDTKTPLKITIYSLAANTILNLILMIPLSHIGIALGSSISAWYNVWLLHKYAHAYGRLTLSSSLAWFCAKVFLSSIIMGIVILVISYYYGYYFYSEQVLIKTFVLALTITCASLVFAASCFYFKLHKIFLAKQCE